MKTMWLRRGQGDRQQYYLCPVVCVDDLLQVAAFVRSGIKKLCPLLHMEQRVLLNRIIMSVRPLNSSCIFAVFLSKNHKPLGFVHVVDDSDPEASGRTALIYVAYSNGLYRGAANEAVLFAEQWAKEHKFSALRAVSRRMNGAAMRLFKHKLKFKPEYVMFSKDLT